MKLIRKTALGVVYATVILASTNALALTLGKMRGAALFGRELDVTVAVQYAADEDSSSNCFAADVSFGDNVVESGRVSVTVVPGASSQSSSVRIRTSSRVDEAVVAVALKTTCAPKAQRRYVLLSEVVNEAVSPVAPSSTSAATGSVTADASGGRKDSAAVPAAQGTVAAAPVSKAAAPAKAPAKVRKAEAAPAAKPVAVAAPANTAALDELVKRVETIEKRQLENSAAAELAKNQDRTKALEADIAGLKAITAKNQQNLQVVTAAMAAQEPEGFGRTLVYALAALLAAGIAAVAYALNRERRGTDSPWWKGQAGRPVEHPLADPGPAVASARAGSVSQQSLKSAPEAAKQAAAQRAAVPAASSTASMDVDIAIDVPSAKAVEPAPQAAVAAQPATVSVQGDFTHSVRGAMRAINTQEMLDIRQQAEFFIALGQNEDAVRLLENSIQTSPDANPLVFLDLLKIFHTLSRRDEFEQYRAEFNQHFTGRVPAYADFLSEGNGLDAYEDICQQIVVLWPTEYTIDFIEQCLVRTPEDDPEQGIDLEAFKDLLLLYGVLKRLDQASDSAMVPFSTSRTANSQFGPASAAQTPTPAVAPTATPATEPLPVVPEVDDDSLPSVDLDLDLSAEAEAPKPAPKNNLIDFDMSSYKLPESGNKSSS